jgi:hypothetical protein
MKQFIFYVNLLMTSIALIIMFLSSFLANDLDSSIGFLVILGLYQVLVSFFITIYALIYNRYLFMLYVFYWIFVIAFFKLFFNQLFYSCLVIALYNIYVNYCSFSNSKYNIINQ